RNLFKPLFPLLPRLPESAGDHPHRTPSATPNANAAGDNATARKPAAQPHRRPEITPGVPSSRGLRAYPAQGIGAHRSNRTADISALVGTDQHSSTSIPVHCGRHRATGVTSTTLADFRERRIPKSLFL